MHLDTVEVVQSTLRTAFEASRTPFELDSSGRLPIPVLPSSLTLDLLQANVKLWGEQGRHTARCWPDRGEPDQERPDASA